MKRILMLFMAASLAYSCNSVKKANSTAVVNSKTIEKKLQQTWILEELNGKSITQKDFQKNTPKIDIKSATFSGTTGCNAINGNLFSTGSKEVEFLNLKSENKKCSTAKKEEEFVKLLKTTTNYSIANDKLSLSNQFGPTMVFKKGN